MVTRVSVDESRPVYPFTAIVGQDEFKTALILNTIDPASHWTQGHRKILYCPRCGRGFSCYRRRRGLRL
jgi:hypothetical protein